LTLCCGGPKHLSRFLAASTWYSSGSNNHFVVLVLLGLLTHVMLNVDARWRSRAW
jgi:hypothetical protein